MSTASVALDAIHVYWSLELEAVLWCSVAESFDIYTEDKDPRV